VIFYAQGKQVFLVAREIRDNEIPAKL